MSDLPYEISRGIFSFTLKPYMKEVSGLVLTASGPCRDGS